MRKLLKVLPSLIAIVVGLLVGFYLMVVVNPGSAAEGMGIILAGASVEGVSGLGRTMYAAAPIIMTGLSVGWAMRTNLFNIGASGQFTVGAFCAIALGVNFASLPAPIHITIAILGGMAGGALWGVVCGALKAYFNVHEVISGIMLNYVAMLFANYLVRTFFYDATFNRSVDVAASATLNSDLLDAVLPGSQISIAFFIALAAVVFAKVVIDRTCLGFELKVSGWNPFAATYAGMSSKKSIIVSLLVAGAFSGLGGALLYLSDFGDHLFVLETVLDQGFTGISIALLGMCDPFGILAAGLFIAHITLGGSYLQLLGYTPEIVDMVIAVIVFFAAMAGPLRLYLERRLSRKGKEAKK